MEYYYVRSIYFCEHHRVPCSLRTPTTTTRTYERALLGRTSSPFLRRVRTTGRVVIGIRHPSCFWIDGSILCVFEIWRRNLSLAVVLHDSKTTKKLCSATWQAARVGWWYVLLMRYFGNWFPSFLLWRQPRQRPTDKECDLHTYLRWVRFHFFGNQWL